jgi:hypothetical protein
MVKTSAKGYARSFAMSEVELKRIELRSNQRYDILLDLKLRQQQKMESLRNQTKKQKKILKEQYDLSEKGILGECVLRSLKFFDVGMSFMGDSLHNIYAGAFVRKKLLKTLHHIFLCRSEC